MMAVPLSSSVSVLLYPVTDWLHPHVMREDWQALVSGPISSGIFLADHNLHYAHCLPCSVKEVLIIYIICCALLCCEMKDQQ